MKKLVFILSFIFLMVGMKAQVKNLDAEFINVPLYLETYVVTGDTFFITKAEGVVYYSYYIHPDNTGRVYIDGRIATSNGKSSEPVPVWPDRVVNYGYPVMLVQDSVTLRVDAAADSAFLFLWKK